MYPLLALLPLLGFILLFKKITSKGTGTGIILAVSLIVIIQYISGLAGILKTGSGILWAAGTITLCVFIWKDRSTLHKHLDLPLILWSALAVLFLAIHHNAYFGFYDELSHWGIFVKELYYNHAFWADDPNIVSV
ncbi:MAG: hypothetical protein ACLFPY_06650 [Desulfonatronovibrio sp.]